MHNYLLQILMKWKQKLCELATVKPLFIEHFYQEETSLSRAKNNVAFHRLQGGLEFYMILWQ